MTTQTLQARPDALKVMEERHSVRAYDKEYKMPEEHLRQIIAAASTAPSSWNLQHWKFLVIQSEEQKRKLLPITFNQQQTVESSVVIAVLGDLEANKNGELVYGEAVKQGKMPAEVKDTLLGQIERAYRSKEAAHDEAIRNASFAAMQLMLAAKALGYDTCPMGGYNRQALVEQFHVPERYIPILLITVGVAAKPAHPSERLGFEQTVVLDSF